MYINSVKGKGTILPESVCLCISLTNTHSSRLTKTAHGQHMFDALDGHADGSRYSNHWQNLVCEEVRQLRRLTRVHGEVPREIEGQEGSEAVHLERRKKPEEKGVIQ